MPEHAVPTETHHLREAIRDVHVADEDKVVRRLMAGLAIPPRGRAAIAAAATGMVERLRATGEAAGIMETFLHEYSLTTEEGVALMCLAEAMLRVPDERTMDALIRDKLTAADWSRHLGRSSSPLVNASTWALLLTGKVIRKEDSDNWDVPATTQNLIRRLGEPVVRNAVAQSMRVLGHQFVLGRNIGEALERAGKQRARGYTYSFDMLGEAARTEGDAKRYFLSYSKAIAAIAEKCDGDDVRTNPGISVKLSALHPRYEYGQRDRVMAELVPRVAALALHAKNAGMGFTIDAEEADRLDLSLDVIEAVSASSDLGGWDGFGIVVQAYQKRAPQVLDWLADLARRHRRRLMVRLVKGAYWDSEIKLAQVQGLDGYPVFTRKASTDVAYLACIEKLFADPAAFYPQFATHNAHTAAAVLEMAKGGGGGQGADFEFQRLHGMGEGLHEVLRADHGRRCRIYAPVGVHKDLLAYLVRRLLENGANSSFVNQIVDADIPAAEVVRDPVEEVESYAAVANPRIPLPVDLYRSARRNSRGFNLADPRTVDALRRAMAPFLDHRWSAVPVIGGAPAAGEVRGVNSPADNRRVVGTVAEAGPEQVAAALDAAVAAAPGWRATPVDDRAACLERAADLYEANAAELIALAARESGKTLPDGVAEVREAVDFLRYYALRARADFGPGGAQAAARGRGVFVCISPWNFPLAIFTGQVAAALAAGNAVIAKPAEQSPLMAARAVALLHQAGVPGGALALLPGDGALVGGALVGDARVDGVCFTGSTATAQAINRAMAATGNPAAPLIAETGGLNAMIVDSTALPEQAVRDIVASAFQSAGQRCSALRALFVQEDVAEPVLEMLSGAMAALRLGDPLDLSTDVGPVIDAAAAIDIQGHCERLEEAGRLVKRLPVPEPLAGGTFVAPAAFTLDRFQQLEREVFGPALHVIRFRAEDLERVVETINGAGYGLTLGIHSRVDDRVRRVSERARVGNIYVNRNQIGAVVGVQPFGGEGLSGTGPKAGGPHYLRRFAAVAAAEEGQENDAPPAAGTVPVAQVAAALERAGAAFPGWDRLAGRLGVLRRCAGRLDGGGVLADALRAALAEADAHPRQPQELRGPTGESNSLTLHGRGVALCLAADPATLARQAALALAGGNTVVAVGGDVLAGLDGALQDAGAPPGVVQAVASDAAAVEAALAEMRPLALVAADGGADRRRRLRQALAGRDGPILPLLDGGAGLLDFVTERVLSIDTTASGGNASLLALDAETRGP
ncbi:MAG: bifunctional proline dehydrogenase/L-glutamate gamma-semialdehyde dehydrogenase PutA [Hyphomicrobiales bacterium]|nr:bifunctional proline dehydrogenase/L-glutamate gamma-semialdehyde dehydrogenase PutA [Hyphomicrobiales bacterium]